MVALYKEGTQIGGKDSPLRVASLSMIFSHELSGGYKESDRIKSLSGFPYYEEMLVAFKFRVSPFAFFQVNTSVFTKMLKVIEDFT